MSRIIIWACLILLTACQAGPPVVEQKAIYPDLKGYFTNEIKRLESSQPQVEKTVHINKESETKADASINWKQELELFIASDINKPAFRKLYSISKTDSEYTYTATDPKLRTREIRILYKNAGKIERVAISNHSQNALYTSDEYLEYCPDSVYQIVKRQEVLITGTNNYWILGKFKK